MSDPGSTSRSAFANAGFQPHLIPIPPPEHDPTLTELEIYALRFRYKGGSSKVDKSDDQQPCEPLLLIHGHPQNSSIWHRAAPILTAKAQRDIVIVDLRGHGHSGVPRVRNFVRQTHNVKDAPAQASVSSRNQEQRMPDEDALRQRYSKRECGRDLAYVMLKYFGYTSFAVVGHDRGGRIAHRMAMDYPDSITRLMVVDIVPTYDLYDRAGSGFASQYWHWFFLIQPYPIPEEMIVHSPNTYLHALVTRFLKGSSETTGNGESEEDKETAKRFPADVLKSYLAQLSSPNRVHAMCEDYRCSAPGGVDLTLDKQDRDEGRKLRQPLSAIWGARGLNQNLFGPQGCLDLWQNVCQQPVSGKALDCGHYIPEEVPDELCREILSFFRNADV